MPSAFSSHHTDRHKVQSEYDLILDCVNTLEFPETCQEISDRASCLNLQSNLNLFKVNKFCV